MPITRTKNLTYQILAVTITASWGAHFVVAELDNNIEIRRFDLEATPEVCAPLLNSIPTEGHNLKQAMATLAYTLVDQLLLPAN